jgi:DNA-binding GntR family transcriptional regulator
MVGQMRSQDSNGSGVKGRDAAYASFTRQLLAREIQPGQSVTQRELVELTGMSLGAIRELVPRLEAEGLISTVPQRGMQVAHIDLTLIRNAFQFRSFLEKEAAAEYVRKVSDAELAAHRAEHEAMLAKTERTVDDGLVTAAQALDWRFHDTIIDSLGNEILSKAYKVNSIKMRLIHQNRTRLFARIVAPTMIEHLKVLDAFETRDPSVASEAIAAHIESARQRALQT